MLSGSTHNLSTGYGIKKIKANDDYVFKRKPPSVSDSLFTRPAAKSALYHPKNMRCILLSLASLTILTFFTQKKKKKSFQLLTATFRPQHLWIQATDVQ